jgi:hypothetical protein
MNISQCAVILIEPAAVFYALAGLAFLFGCSLVFVIASR